MTAARTLVSAIACALLALTMGCASRTTTAAAGDGTADGTVSVRTSNFAFEPNVVRAKAGRPLVLHVANDSGSAHNITILDADGSVLRSADVPPDASVDVDLTPPRPGEYKFYCDKPFHSTFGMTGRILAD